MEQKNTEQALLEIYERLRPGEPPTENAKVYYILVSSTLNAMI